MNFGFTEEQLELQEMVREFVEKEITPIAGEMDAENATRPELFKMAADMGLLNVIVPEEYGGLGLDSVTVAMMYEELGKGCAGVATSMAANALATAPVLIAGTDEQKRMWRDILNEGGLAAFALTEPGAGSDAGGVSTRAVHDKEKKTYTLNGTKAFITNGGIADIYLIFANTRKDGGIRGLTGDPPVILSVSEESISWKERRDEVPGGGRSPCAGRGPATGRGHRRPRT